MGLIVLGAGALKTVVASGDLEFMEVVSNFDGLLALGAGGWVGV